MIAPALLLAIAAPQATPHAHPAACPSAATLPPEMEGWASPGTATAGASASQPAPLTLGAAVTATLLPTARVAFSVRPEKQGSSSSSGGLFRFDVAAAGRYRVALGSAAWVDVVSGTTPAVSVSHGHGPACSTVRKMVDFDLKPGRYLLQVSGHAGSTLPLMVARLP